ncbi:hypothetical protein [Micromonospora pisi]|nr:hypothetical protein [Micromonospora pisi]
MGAVAALLTAVVAGLTFLYQVGQSEPERATPPAAQSGKSAPATTSAAIPNTSADAPVWSNTLLFDNSGIDFDVTPPSNDDPGPEMDIYDGSSNQLVTFRASRKNVARWTDAGDPTASDCANLLQSYGVNTAKFDQNSRFCVRTGNDRLVLIKFLRPRDGAWEIHATVWNMLD